MLTPLRRSIAPSGIRSFEYGTPHLAVISSSPPAVSLSLSLSLSFFLYVSLSTSTRPEILFYCHRNYVWSLKKSPIRQTNRVRYQFFTNGFDWAFKWTPFLNVWLMCCIISFHMAARRSNGLMNRFKLFSCQISHHREEIHFLKIQFFFGHYSIKIH